MMDWTKNQRPDMLSSTIDKICCLIWDMRFHEKFQKAFQDTNAIASIEAVPESIKNSC